MSDSLKSVLDEVWAKERMPDLLGRIREALEKKPEPEQAEPEIDVTVEDHGSVFLVTPKSEIAGLWMDENIPGDAQWYGASLVVEHRYIEPIIQGMREEGLNVQVS